MHKAAQYDVARFICHYVNSVFVHIKQVHRTIAERTFSLMDSKLIQARNPPRILNVVISKPYKLRKRLQLVLATPPAFRE